MSSLGSLNGKRGAVLLRAWSVSCLGLLFSAYHRKGAQLELCLQDCHGRHPPVPMWPYSDSRRCHTVPGWLLVLLWSSLSPPGQGPALYCNGDMLLTVIQPSTREAEVTGSCVPECSGSLDCSRTGLAQRVAANSSAFEPQLFSLIAPRKPSVSDTLSIPRNSSLKEQALKGLVAVLASPLASGLPLYCGWGQGTKTFLPPQQLAVPSKTEQDRGDRHHHDWPVSSEACQCSPALFPPGMSQ